MSVEQHDKSYGERTITRVLVSIAALMVVGVFLIPTAVNAPRITTAGYVLMGFWGLVLIMGVLWVGRVGWRYHCPKCGARLPPLKTDASTNYQHRFHCSACDIVWTTDVYAGDAPVAKPGAAPNGVPSASLGDSVAQRGRHR